MGVKRTTMLMFIFEHEKHELDERHEFNEMMVLKRHPR